MQVHSCILQISYSLRLIRRSELRDRNIIILVEKSAIYNFSLNQSDFNEKGLIICRDRLLDLFVRQPSELKMILV